MTVGPEARSWLHEEVRAFLGTDREATRIEGRVIAYSAGPQVLIEAPDGERDWWDVRLCEKTTETNRLRQRARIGGPAGRVARFVLHQAETGEGMPV